jgi:alpha-galactosidase
VKNVVCDLILTGEFENSEVVVVDLLREPMDIVVNACKFIIANRGSGIKVRGTLDREEALKDADFVLVAISVGGFGIWEKDIEICKKYGINHVVGDTIGPAAMIRAFRTIPVMLDIARDVERICPHAWIINVSNPMTTLVKAVSRYTKVKILGLCHGSYEIKERIAAAYGVDIS